MFNINNIEKQTMKLFDDFQNGYKQPLMDFLILISNQDNLLNQQIYNEFCFHWNEGVAKKIIYGENYLNLDSIPKNNGAFFYTWSNYIDKKYIIENKMSNICYKQITDEITLFSKLFDNVSDKFIDNMYNSNYRLNNIIQRIKNICVNSFMFNKNDNNHYLKSLFITYFLDKNLDDPLLITNYFTKKEQKINALKIKKEFITNLNSNQILFIYNFNLDKSVSVIKDIFLMNSTEDEILSNLIENKIIKGYNDYLDKTLIEKNDLKSKCKI